MWETAGTLLFQVSCLSGSFSVVLEKILSKLSFPSFHWKQVKRDVETILHEREYHSIIPDNPLKCRVQSNHGQDPPLCSNSEDLDRYWLIHESNMRDRYAFCLTNFSVNLSRHKVMSIPSECLTDKLWSPLRGSVFRTFISRVAPWERRYLLYFNSLVKRGISVGGTCQRKLHLMKFPLPPNY